MTGLLVLPFSGISHRHIDHYPCISDIRITSVKLRNIASQAIDRIPTSLPECENDELPKDFVPGPFDVICSQGKTAKNHPGNRFFQSVIYRWAKEYANTTEKRNKSKIVRNIIETIRAESANGGFIRKGESGRWRIVRQDQAREKVSQSLRDTLAGNYRSSLMAKKRSRMESNLKRMVDFEEDIGNNRFVYERISCLSKTIKNSNDPSSKCSLDDSEILKLMNETNCCILRQLREDRNVQLEVQLEQPQQTQDDCQMKSSPSYEGVDETLKRFQTDKGFMLLHEPSPKRYKNKF